MDTLLATYLLLSVMLMIVATIFDGNDGGAA
jgi:hypothetical protein